MPPICGGKYFALINTERGPRAEIKIRSLHTLLS